MPRVLTETDVADFRERLCEVATRLYVEKGRDGLNMRELTSRLGVSAMTPYRYFKDKVEILSAIRARAFARFADQLEKALAQPGTPAEKSRAVTKAYVHFAREEQACYRLMFDLSRQTLPALPELAAAEKRARDTMINHVRHLVRSGYYAGDPELIGPVLWAGLHGVVTLNLAGALTDGPEFENVLRATLCSLSKAYRTVDKADGSKNPA